MESLFTKYDSALIFACIAAIVGASYSVIKAVVWLKEQLQKFLNQKYETRSEKESLDDRVENLERSYKELKETNDNNFKNICQQFDRINESIESLAEASKRSEEHQIQAKNDLEQARTERDTMLKMMSTSLDTIRLLSYARLSEEIERLLTQGYATPAERRILEQMFSNYKDHGWNGDMDARLDKVHNLPTAPLVKREEKESA